MRFPTENYSMYGNQIMRNDLSMAAWSQPPVNILFPRFVRMNDGMAERRTQKTPGPRQKRGTGSLFFASVRKKGAIRDCGFSAAITKDGK